MTSGNGEERIEFYWQQEKQTVDISVPISVGDEAVAEMRKAKKIEIDAGMNWGIRHAYAVIFDDESESPFVVGATHMDFPKDTGQGLDFNHVPDERLRFASATIYNPAANREQLLASPELRNRYIIFQNIPAVSRVKTHLIKGRMIDDRVR